MKKGQKNSQLCKADYPLLRHTKHKTHKCSMLSISAPLCFFNYFCWRWENVKEHTGGECDPADPQPKL